MYNGVGSAVHLFSNKQNKIRKNVQMCKLQIVFGKSEKDENG